MSGNPTKYKALVPEANPVFVLGTQPLRLRAVNGKIQRDEPFGNSTRTHVQGFVDFDCGYRYVINGPWTRQRTRRRTQRPGYNSCLYRATGGSWPVGIPTR